MERRPGQHDAKEEDERREHGRSEGSDAEEQFPGQHGKPPHERERKPARQTGETRREPGRGESPEAPRQTEMPRKFGERPNQPSGEARERRSK